MFQVARKPSTAVQLCLTPPPSSKKNLFLPLSSGNQWEVSSWLLQISYPTGTNGLIIFINFAKSTLFCHFVSVKFCFLQHFSACNTWHMHFYMSQLRIWTNKWSLINQNTRNSIFGVKISITKENHNSNSNSNTVWHLC